MRIQILRFWDLSLPAPHGAPDGCSDSEPSWARSARCGPDARSRENNEERFWGVGMKLVQTR